MGCGASGTTTRPKGRARDAQQDQNKATVLVFGMPDSGQVPFVKAMEKCFHSVGAFAQNPYVFVSVPTDRASRPSWPKEFERDQKVVCSFFFVSLTSDPDILLSVKVANWIRAQAVDKCAVPNVVAYVKSARDIAQFQTLKEHLPATVEPMKYGDESADIQTFVEVIQKSAATKAEADAGQ